MLEERQLDWWEQWKHEGKREGIREGETRLLRNLLESRFGLLPAWVDERLSTAAEADLVSWGKKMLQPALSLEELFRS